MGQDVDVARVATALNMPEIRYQTFGNKPVWAERQNRAGAHASFVAPAVQEPMAPQQLVAVAGAAPEACLPQHAGPDSAVAQTPQPQPAVDPAGPPNVFTSLRAESPVPPAAMPQPRENASETPSFPEPPVALFPLGRAPSAPAMAGPGSEMAAQPPAPAGLNPAAIAAAFQPRPAAPVVRPLFAPAAPAPAMAPAPAPPPVFPPSAAPAAPPPLLGGAASLLATLQATAAEAAGPAPRSGLLAQVGSAAPPPPVQPAAPSLLAALGGPLAPPNAAPPAPASLAGLLRSLGAPPAPPATAPGGGRLAEVLGGLRPSGAG